MLNSLIIGINTWKGICLKFKYNITAKLFLAGQSPFSMSCVQVHCISLARSDGVPDAGIARYFSAILETVGKLWECGKSGKTGGVGRWISFLPPN